MTPSEKKELNGHVQAIAKLLYKHSLPEQLETLSKIEETVRKQTLEYISPQIGFFSSQKPQEQHQEELEN
jgi:hypothetical protein